MDISTIIGQYAFPIVACIAMAWYIRDQSKSHREEMKEITKALHNNTLAIQHLTDVLGGDGK